MSAEFKIKKILGVRRVCQEQIEINGAERCRAAQDTYTRCPGVYQGVSLLRCPRIYIWGRARRLIK